jgi:hypothetical protein
MHGAQHPTDTAGRINDGDLPLAHASVTHQRIGGGEAGKAGANDQGMGAVVVVIHEAMVILREASIVVGKLNGGLTLGTLRRLSDSGACLRLL